MPSTLVTKRIPLGRGCTASDCVLAAKAPPLRVIVIVSNKSAKRDPAVLPSNNFFSKIFRDKK
jgi:hypothetical protein